MYANRHRADMATAVLALVIMSVSNTLGRLNKGTERLVVQGDYAEIKDFGYAAYLGIHCDMKEENITEMFTCGSSILNQLFLLTAAHCLADCKKSSFVSVNVGSANYRKGIQKSTSQFKTHKKFNFDDGANDIALIKINGTLQFKDSVYRVVLMKHPPQDKVAVVSGWGLTDEVKEIREMYLKYTKQRVWSRRECSLALDDLPKGIICAGEKKSKSYASFGDSGGALVVRKSIQIGIVSYKIISVTRSLLVYTNVSYFYGWIHHHTKYMNC